jgi:hypothetical protein
MSNELLVNGQIQTFRAYVKRATNIKLCINDSKIDFAAIDMLISFNLFM